MPSAWAPTVLQARVPHEFPSCRERGHLLVKGFILGQHRESPQGNWHDSTQLMHVFCTSRLNGVLHISCCSDEGVLCIKMQTLMQPIACSDLHPFVRGCAPKNTEKTHQDGRRAGWPGNFDEDSGYQRAETKFDEGRGAGRRFDEGREVRRRGRGFDEGRYKRPRQSPKKDARVRRRLNERRRFDEGHKGREGVRRRPRVSTKARGVRRPLPKAVCHPPPYAVLIGLPLKKTAWAFPMSAEMP